MATSLARSMKLVLKRKDARIMSARPAAQSCKGGTRTTNIARDIFWTAVRGSRNVIMTQSFVNKS